MKEQYAYFKKQSMMRKITILLIFFGILYGLGTVSLFPSDGANRYYSMAIVLVPLLIYRMSKGKKHSIFNFVYVFDHDGNLLKRIFEYLATFIIMLNLYMNFEYYRFPQLISFPFLLVFLNATFVKNTLD